MRELRQLVQRFIDNGIGYADFRREVVARFLAPSDRDDLVRQVYHAIESACSAFEHQYIDAPHLNAQLAALPWPIESAQEVRGQNGDMRVVLYVRANVGARVGALTSNSLSSPERVSLSNQQVAVEDEMAYA